MSHRTEKELVAGALLNAEQPVARFPLSLRIFLRLGTMEPRGAGPASWRVGGHLASRCPAEFFRAFDTRIQGPSEE